MLVRPSAVYRNVAYLVVFLFVCYVGKSIIGYDDGKHITHPRNPKRLYLTVDKNRIEHRFDKLAPKRILVWTTIFGEQEAKDKLLDCPGLSDRCIIETDHERLTAADAVIIHMPNAKEGLPPANLRKPNQRYVFMTMETPSNIQKIDVPKHYFNWTMTYLFSSDVLFKYGGYWITSKEAELRGFKIGDYFVDPGALQKSKSGVFGLISNCDTESKREYAIRELGKHIPVTVVGKCAGDQTNRELCPKGQNCDAIIAQYPFFLAAENTVCEDYVTEKYWSRNLLPSIPIVLRRRPYKNVNLPPQSVISFDDFNSPKEMGEFLLSLERNFTAYQQYFKWRNGGWTLVPWNAPGYRNSYCKLCEKLWDPDQEESTIEDAYAWFEAESRCEGKEFVQEWIVPQ